MVEIIKSAVAALKMCMCMFDFMKLERGKKSLLLSEKVVDYVVDLCFSAVEWQRVWTVFSVSGSLTLGVWEGADRCM